MRILIFCQLFPPLVYGGGEVFLWNLARSLVSRGHEVHVITQRVRGEEDFETRSGVNIRRVGRSVDYRGGLTTNLTDSLAFMVGAFFSGIRLASRRHTEIIHSNTYVPALIGQVCASILRKRHVMTVHDVYLLTMPWFWRSWSRQPTVGFLARFLGPFLERFLLRMPVSVVHTVSETSKRDLVQVGTASKLVVVPNGIDISDYGIESEVPCVPHQAIFVGRLVFYKNLEVVFRAFVKVVGVISDAKLVIVGDGPMRTAWEQMVHDLGLEGHVHFCGRIPHTEKLRLLQESAFLILPSMVEGFGIVILEAFACKKPVLASSIGALREVVSDGIDGYLVKPTSEEDWSQMISRLFEDQARTQEMGLMGRKKLIAEFSVERVTKEMETLYEFALAQG